MILSSILALISIIDFQIHSNVKQADNTQFSSTELKLSTLYSMC